MRHEQTSTIGGRVMIVDTGTTCIWLTLSAYKDEHGDQVPPSVVALTADEAAVLGAALLTQGKAKLVDEALELLVQS